MKDILEQISKRPKRKVKAKHVFLFTLVLLSCSAISVVLVHLLMLASEAAK